jgi:hypothetical protein
MTITTNLYMRKILYLLILPFLLFLGCKKSDAPKSLVSLDVFKSNLVGTWAIGSASVQHSAKTDFFVKDVQLYRYRQIYKQDGQLTLQGIAESIPSLDRTYIISQDGGKIYLSFADEKEVSHKFELKSYTNNEFTMETTVNYSPAINGIGTEGNGEPFFYNREVFTYTFQRR